MGKTVRKILSPHVVKAVDGILQNHHESKERVREDIRRNESLLAPDGSIDVTNPEAQKGRVLSRAQLVERIRRLNPDLWYEQSINYPKQGGLYIQDLSSPFGKRLVVGFPHDQVSEFSLRMTVPDIIPNAAAAAYWETIRRVDNQIPGWRSVLLKLIMEGLISPSGAEREFKITQGRSSQHWQRATT